MAYAASHMGSLGILGGGQLARMTALAARSLGYRVYALDPRGDCPVAPLVERLVVAPFEDVGAASALAAMCDVVTVDVEHVPAHVAAEVSRLKAMRPSASALHTIQDRGRQKDWLSQHGFPVGPYRVVSNAAELHEARRVLRGDVFIKAATGGFDGRGQCFVAEHADAERALEHLGATRMTVETVLPLKAELSVLVARRPSGQTIAYPPALNHHEHGILSYSLLPGLLPEQVSARATDVAIQIAEALEIEGLCAVEMFLLEGDALLVNEIAPRPHNSYHGSERACETSQFEQHVRAVFDLPLGPVGIVRPTAMANLLGDLWLGDRLPDFGRALLVPGVRAQLYGKGQPRRGRKLGHLTAIGNSIEQALERVLFAKDQLLSARPSEFGTAPLSRRMKEPS